MSDNTPNDNKSCVQINVSSGVYTVIIDRCTGSENANSSGTASPDGPNYNYRGLYGFKHLTGGGSPYKVLGTVTLNGSVVYYNQ